MVLVEWWVLSLSSLTWTNLLLLPLLVQEMNLFPLIRGFALNTANSQTLGIQCPSIDWCLEGKNEDDPCCADPCKLVRRPYAD